MRLAARLAIFGLLTALATPALADPSDPAAAEALFRAGRAAADKGDFAAACPKFEESKRLDPTLGTLFNLADCDEHIGKLASAWQLFREVAQRLSTGDERIGIASGRAAAIEPRLPKLALKVSSSLPASAVVLRDGVEMGSASYDLPIPVDPGDHVIVVKVPGRADRQYPVKAVMGQVSEIAIEPGAPLPPASSGAQTSGVSAEVSSSGDGGRRTLGYVLLGVGGAAIVTSGVAGALALSAKSTVESGCNAEKRCSQDALDAADRGRTASTISTVAFGAGIAAAAVGTFFVISHGDSKPSAAKAPAVGFAVVPGSAFVTLQGRLW